MRIWIIANIFQSKADKFSLQIRTSIHFGPLQLFIAAILFFLPLSIYLFYCVLLLFRWLLRVWRLSSIVSLASISSMYGAIRTGCTDSGPLHFGKSWLFESYITQHPYIITDTYDIPNKPHTHTEHPIASIEFRAPEHCCWHIAQNNNILPCQSKTQNQNKMLCDFDQTIVEIKWTVDANLSWRLTLNASERMQWFDLFQI